MDPLPGQIPEYAYDDRDEDCKPRSLIIARIHEPESLEQCNDHSELLDRIPSPLPDHDREREIDALAHHMLMDQPKHFEPQTRILAQLPDPNRTYDDAQTLDQFADYQSQARISDCALDPLPAQNFEHTSVDQLTIKRFKPQARILSLPPDSQTDPAQLLNKQLMLWTG